MRKIFVIIALTAALALGCSACVAEAQQSGDSWLQDSVDGAVWVDDRAFLEIFAEGEGYRVLILWGSSTWETTEWVYSCLYDAETGKLTAVHMSCDNVVYDEDGNETRTNVQDRDCETVFALNEEGKIVITNAADESLEGKAFERMPAEDTDF